MGLIIFTIKNFSYFYRKKLILTKILYKGACLKINNFKIKLRKLQKTISIATKEHQLTNYYLYSTLLQLEMMETNLICSF